MFNAPMDILLLFALGLSVQQAVFKRSERLAGVFAILGLLMSMVFVLQLLVLYRGPFMVSLTDVFPAVASYFRIDLFSIFLALVSLSMAIVIVLYDLQHPGNRKTSYYILLLSCMLGILGVAFSYDLFTLMVFWEVMAISSYFLVAFNGERSERAALKYVLISLAGSAFLLFALSLIFGQVQSLNFLDVIRFAQAADSNLVRFLFVLSMVCFAIKAGAVPFHAWVPDTYQEAYTPTSALFSSVLSKVGLFALLRLALVFIPVSSFIQVILMLMAIASMFLGNVLALFEKDFKRLLAFSSIAHMGYILFAVSMLTVSGLTAGVLHMVNHAVAIALMFLVAGACIFMTGRKRLAELGGIGRVNRVLGLGIVLGVLTMMGVPGLAMFVSELMIALAGIGAGWFIPVGIFLFNLLLSVVYYIRILRELVVSKPRGRVAGSIPMAFQASVLILAVASLLIGLYPGPAIEFARAVAASLLR